MPKLNIVDLRKKNEFNEFSLLYESFLQKKINNTELTQLLEVAIIFLNCEDQNIKNFGYKIILEHALSSKEYKALYDITLNLGYVPVAKLVELVLDQKEFSQSFIRQFYSSYKESFRDDSHRYLTIGQIQLNNEVMGDDHINRAVVAPTSYGKSECIISLANSTNKSCIIVPTKALLAQTKKRLLDSKIDFTTKPLLVHNEMFTGNLNKFVAVLTQERLMSVLQEFPALTFDKVFVDEAHNLLDKDDRARLLASTIIIIKKRSPRTQYYFFTPFLIDITNLELKFANIETVEVRKNEYIKSEKIYVCDFRSTKSPKLQLYDQFMNELYVLPEVYNSEVELIQKSTRSKSIVYLNLPKDVEEFTKRFIENLPEIESEEIEAAAESLKDYIHEDYFLLKCLKRGVAYHHGGMPDNVKLFVEHLYATQPQLKYIVSTSTLLEGVNIPADQIYLLSLSRGSSNLTPSHLKNLIGRVSRFSDIFSIIKKENLEMLMPKIFIVGTQYTRKNTKFKDFLSTSLAIAAKANDRVENELLSNTKKANEETQKSYIELIESVQPNATGQKNVRVPKTDFGKFCFKNRVVEFDIFNFENEGQQIANQLLYAKRIAKDEHELVENMHDLFIGPLVLNYLLENDDKNPFERKFFSFYALKKQGARNLHAMYLRWKEKGTSYKQMVSTVANYWQKNNEAGLVYVDKWGELVGSDQSVYKRYINVNKKTTYELNNYAIVRIKDEQDFIEYTLFKFIDIMNDLLLIDDNYYKRLKYGTDNEKTIFLIKNGISSSLSKLLLTNYSNFLSLNISGNQYSINDQITKKMADNNENLILINEINYHVSRTK